jgi:Phage integrase, N-terminal SAM-like domain
LAMGSVGLGRKYPDSNGLSVVCHFAENCAEVESPNRPLLTRMRRELHTRHYNRRTKQTYCNWVKRFIHFHNFRQPAEMAESEINAHPTHLAVPEKVSTSTQNQAFSALLFLYRHVISREVGDLSNYSSLS